MSDNRIRIFDTTLRDGEQAPGCSMTLKEKLRVAKALAELKVDIIEAGFPAASPGDFESVKAIADSNFGPVICGLARCNPGDIEKVYEAVVKGQVPEEPGLPESFNVLVRELQALALDVELLQQDDE